MIRMAKRSLAVALLFLFGCGNGKTSRDGGLGGSIPDFPDSCIVGTLGCACDANQSCDGNLVCASQTCVQRGGTGGSGGAVVQDGAVDAAGSVGGARGTDGPGSGDGRGSGAGGMSSAGDGSAGGLGGSGGSGSDAARDTTGGLEAGMDNRAGGGRCQTLRVAPERHTDHVKVVDLDGDGHLDVVSADDDGVITFYRGTGGRTFDAPKTIPVIASDLDFIAVGHLDGDGRLDLATTGIDKDPYILLSTGPATFGSPIKLLNVGTGAPVPRSSWDIDIVDLDADGNPDVVVTDALYARFDVYWGDRSGSFGPATTLVVPGQPVASVFGDFNEDGRPDAVEANLKLSATLIPMGADRSLQTPLSITAFGAYEAAIGDLNRDGHLDLAIPEQSRGNVIVRLGDGKGGLSVPTSNPPTLEKGLWSIAIADFDGDGLPDLAIGNGDKKDVSFLRGDGTGKFGAATHVATAWSARNLEAGDFDHDGVADLVAPEWGQGFTVIFGPCP